ncbi:elongation factor 4 [Plakobranchus ocellatus]|uniref:Elongation factor 4 n=1 Tax=Plakobranchus ocellatus TaxID=259542 RepID=A0AAV4DHB8_9GAST|nr:elongation factor 4 [Plakobranchus ocellatus]
MYICHDVTVKDKATGNATSRRSKNLQYQLEIDGEKIPVCKTFFLHTLRLSDHFVFTALSKKDEGGHISPDMRGRHKKMIDLMKEERDRIRAHMLPAESHYCRKDSERLYLGASLNLATMYRLYCETRHRE